MKIIEKISLVNFRCHERFDFECENSTALLIGRNGCGKTSVLEAVYLALRGKSFKGVDREILRREAEFYRVQIELADGGMIIIRYDGNEKTFELSGKKNRRLPKRNKYPVVLFEPDNLYLVGSSPGRRRDYFDELFRQMSEKYALALARYEKSLKQRNDLLKEENVAPNDLFSWNIMCANYGAELMEFRTKFLAQINARLTDNYRGIAGNDDSCEIAYTGEILDENAYLARLERNFEKERVLGYTLFGVHRDDYEFRFNGKKADGSASRGEIRSLVLALKFIEAQILEEETGRAPIVLLDDIFSELDEQRQRHLVENFKKYQMIVTSTATPAGMMPDRVLD